MTLLEQATDFQQKASGPQIMEAVDTYYADDITIVEGNGDTFHGKDTQKGRILEWMDSVEETHGGDITAIAAHETAPGSGVVFVESWVEATFKGAGRMKMEEVAVQQWSDGQITHERFYFDASGMGM